MINDNHPVTRFRRRAAVGVAALLLTSAMAMPAAAQDSPYGINTHVPGPAKLDRVAAAGLSWIRIDMDWVHIETPAKGRFHWGPIDRAVNEAHRRGLRVLATIAYTPAWANGGQDRAVPPSNPQDWADFVGVCVRRYRNTVKHWGLWNEANLPQFWRGSADQYVDQIVVPGYHAVKNADPTAQTAGPDLAHISSFRSDARWDKWLKPILRRGGRYFDIITHHIYKDDPFRYLDGWTWPWEGDSVREVLQDNGQGQKPFWLTETGWRSDRVGFNDQATNLRRLLRGIDDRRWIQKVFIYEISDDPNWNQKWGILHADLTPKPAYHAYRDYIAQQGTTSAPPPSPTPAPPSPTPAPPSPTPTSGQRFVFEAERDLSHQVGRREGSGWAANTTDDAPGYMCFGPYTQRIPSGLHQAVFRLLVDNNTHDDAVVTVVDVHDATSGRVLASRSIRRREFSATFAYQDFTLSFSSQAGHSLELRTHWTDRSYVRQDRVEVVVGAGSSSGGGVTTPARRGGFFAWLRRLFR